jgi:hypothetical protein
MLFTIYSLANSLVLTTRQEADNPNADNHAWVIPRGA